MLNWETVNVMLEFTVSLSNFIDRKKAHVHVCCIDLSEYAAGDTENMGLFRFVPIIKSVPVNLRTAT